MGRQVSDRIIVTYFLLHPEGKVICGSCGRWVTDAYLGVKQTKESVERHVAECPHLNKMRRDLEPFVVTVPKEGA
jgi:hypothetical protein